MMTFMNKVIKRKNGGNKFYLEPVIRNQNHGITPVYYISIFILLKLYQKF